MLLGAMRVLLENASVERYYYPVNSPVYKITKSNFIGNTTKEYSTMATSKGRAANNLRFQIQKDLNIASGVIIDTELVKKSQPVQKPVVKKEPKPDPNEGQLTIFDMTRGIK